jgi:hypothetical protein
MLKDVKALDVGTKKLDPAGWIGCKKMQKDVKSGGCKSL